MSLTLGPKSPTYVIVDGAQLTLDLSEALGASEAGSSQILTLYMPSATKSGESLENPDFWIEEAATLLTKIGGGATIMPPVRGGWRTPDGQIIWEDTVLIYTYIQPDAFVELLPELRSFLHRLGRETEQGEVACQFDNRFYRIRNFDRGA